MAVVAYCRASTAKQIASPDELDAIRQILLGDAMLMRPEAR